MNEKQVEEVKMLSEAKEPLQDLDKCSFHELINILQKILMILLLMFIRRIWFIHRKLCHKRKGKLASGHCYFWSLPKHTVEMCLCSVPLQFYGTFARTQHYGTFARTQHVSQNE
jgi:hypothetical protein